MCSLFIAGNKFSQARQGPSETERLVLRDAIFSRRTQLSQFGYIETVSFAERGRFFGDLTIKFHREHISTMLLYITQRIFSDVHACFYHTFSCEIQKLRTIYTII